jgi:hypothetical protein
MSRPFVCHVSASYEDKHWTGQVNNLSAHVGDGSAGMEYGRRYELWSNHINRPSAYNRIEGQRHTDFAYQEGKVKLIIVVFWSLNLDVNSAE